MSTENPVAPNQEAEFEDQSLEIAIHLSTAKAIADIIYICTRATVDGSESRLDELNVQTLRALVYAIERHIEEAEKLQEKEDERKRRENEAAYHEAERKRQRAEDGLSTPATPREWKDKHRSLVGMHLRTLRDHRGIGDLPPEMRDLYTQIYGARFRFTAADVSRIDSIVYRFSKEMHAAIDHAVVVDARAPARPGHLRVVVDNTGVSP